MNNLQNWNIPEHFHQVPSQVEGITAFAPKPVQTQEHSPRTYQCPSCGASTKFNVAAAGIACEHCGYTAATISDIVGRSAAEQEFTLATLSIAEQGWGVERKTLTCENCGAVISLPQDVLSSSCSFCASHKVNLSTAPDDILRPKFLIPFKISPDKIRSLAQAWLGKGWYHPPELASNSLIQKFNGIYLPYWTFDAQIDAAWRAQVGHERTVRDKDGNSRTVIDWRWEKGQAHLNIDDLPLAATSKISHHLLAKLLPFQFQALTAYSPDFLAGWQALNFNITLPDAWEEAKQAMRESAQQACRSQIHSAHVRNFSMTADFNDEAWRCILLPVYLAVYKHEGKVFQVMVNGQTGTVSGQKPVAWWKVWLAITAMLTPGLALGLIGFPLLLLGGAGVILISLGFILLVFGGAGAVILYNHAADSERA
jgi:ribosomal protein L37AE/L43A